MEHMPRRYPINYSFVAEASAVRGVQADQYCLHVHVALHEHYHVRNAQAMALQGNQRLAANAQLSLSSTSTQDFRGKKRYRGMIDNAQQYINQLP